MSCLSQGLSLSMAELKTIVSELNFVFFVNFSQ